MASGGDQRRFLALVGVSLAIHAGAMGWVATRPAPPPTSAATRTIEMELVSNTPEQPRAEKPEVTPPPPPKVAMVRPTQRNPQTTSTPQTDTPRASTEPSSGAPSQGVGTRGDMPVASTPSLLPSTGFVMSLSTGGTEEAPRGNTVRNGPGEAPDQASLNEYTGEVLTRKLNSDLREDLGRAAVAVGNVPVHFKRFENAMRTALPKAKIDKTPMTGKDALGEVAGMMFNSGPSDEATRKVSDTASGRAILGGPQMTNLEDQRSREGALAMLTQAENIKERVHRARLRTVLEMTTDAMGVVADAHIVEKSGDARFDESVLHFSRKVARQLPDNDEKLLGTSTWRTRWQFTWEPPDVRVRLINAWRVDER